ncbi:hypothetical protein PT067_08205 [Erysipelothrix rhusiopathiae]|uniref:hypothetical protein n=1 Tax=Erysipelothrix TaxID=1647 RepID=UPI00190DE0C4|nr:MULTISPECIES: hypothetical protein [Erysipelothrix]MBK2401750.1 hypothetical protein [Erysipelothrix sp. strain 2 (EsS2-6-Brazil)]MBK2403913.1 hypothetical protein [Erysipelothrix sp. strain 2 (EsS2-7-Brazil)]MDE8044253.1 hypothetical protein [Erysipelothrix rhusiopathiae]MDE8052190.1 hypothetical protein [Erysipelothrix rhusiopathiae]MDE8060610.1 hypothetical protein [Erysipelothrix rhusiopathiae]
MMEMVQEIKKYLQVLEPNITITDVQIDMILNRIKVYLNRSDIPFILSSTIAEMIIEQAKMNRKNDDDTISSISDNGQSISFSNKVFQSMMSQKDVDLFASHTAILNRFRKVGVIGVHPFKNE